MNDFVKRLEQGRYARLLGLGSSNTECSSRPDLNPGWLQWVDFGLRQLYGRFFITINSGSSGQTSVQLLERLDETVAVFKPHLVLLTVGGNDANPKKSVSEEQYAASLAALFERISGWDGCELVFQTYYAPIYSKLPSEHAERFRRCMAAGVRLAGAMNIGCYDHLPVWEALKQDLGEAEYERRFFTDAMHLNALGNQLWAWQILKRMVVPAHLSQLDEHFEAVKAWMR